MTGDDLLAARERLGLDRIAFARALGYRGNPANLKRLMRRYEKLRGNDVPQPVSDLVVSYQGSQLCKTD